MAKTAKTPKKALKKQAAGPVAQRAAKPAAKQSAKKARTERPQAEPRPVGQPAAPAPTGEVLDRLHGVILSRRDVDPTLSHSARLLSRGPAKVAQKFGEEAVEALIEGVTGDKSALISESADVLYHLLVLWVASGVEPAAVWAELHRREGVSGVVEKAGRALKQPGHLGTTKIP